MFFANSGAEAIEAAIKWQPSHRPRRARGRRGRLPRPHHGCAGADPQGGLPRAVRAAARRREHVPFGDIAALRAAVDGHRGGRSRTDPGRGRACSAARRLPQAAREVTRRARRAADPRRGPDRHGPDRQVVRQPGRPGIVPGRRDPRQGPGRRLPGRRAASRSARKRPTCWPRASTARRSAATRWPPPPPWPSSRAIESEGLLEHARARRRSTWPRPAALGHPLRDRGPRRGAAARLRPRPGRRPGGRRRRPRRRVHRQRPRPGRHPPGAPADRDHRAGSTPSSRRCPHSWTPDSAATPTDHPEEPDDPPLPARRRPQPGRAGRGPATSPPRSRPRRTRAPCRWPGRRRSR